MVASGLPERNGDLHAAEIANLAIALQSITPTIVVTTVFPRFWPDQRPVQCAVCTPYDYELFLSLENS